MSKLQTGQPAQTSFIAQPVIQISADEIAKRAREIFMTRGGADGFELADWLQAERELRVLECQRAEQYLAATHN